MNFFFFLACLTTLAVACAQNYCDSSFCSGGKLHIGCNNTGAWAPKCGSDRRLVDMTPLKNQILKYHNEVRNKVAGGELEPYEPAERMATMEWDEELAKLAEFNVKKCEMVHDDCHKTQDYPKSGQNLAKHHYPSSDEVMVSTLIHNWFDEHKRANMSIINKYVGSKDTKKQYGHFTTMVNDINRRVGCAASRTTMEDNKYFFLACNYAGNNFSNKKIYATSKVPASGCKSKDDEYANLCGRTEVY